MKEATLYTRKDPAGTTVQCYLCKHNCLIKEGKRGICKVRQNRGGTLFSMVYGKLVSENSDPIEKKPLFHLLPGSRSYSIATVGCNFRCLHCQNHEISHYPVNHTGPMPGVQRSPAQVVSSARQSDSQSISYTYIEPTIFFEFAYETAILAHEAGIKNVFVSNGYTSTEATRLIAPYLDGNNIDLKAFNDNFYRDVCGAKLSHVMDTIVLMKELGVWVEVTTLLIPGLNDSDKELKGLAEFLVGIDPHMPWHVSRFYPTFRMTDRPPTQPATLHRACEIGAEAGLQYVYTGNIPGQGGEDTNCPGCGKTVIHRLGYRIIDEHLDKGRCGYCGSSIAGVFD